MGVERRGGVSLSGFPKFGAFANDQDIEFDRDAFAKVIKEKGYDVTWYKAAFCPNTPPGTLSSRRDHAFSCPICDGTGFVYFDPCNTRVLMMGMKLDQSFYAYGRWDHGTSMVTAEPGLRLSFFDRLVLNNSLLRYTERIVRTPGQTTDVLAYPALCVEYVGWVNRVGQLQTFVSGQHYQLSQGGGSIEWLITTGLPDDRSRYVVAYEYRPRYVVIDLPHAHRDQREDGKERSFPVQAMARLDYLVRERGLDPQQVVDESPFPER
jgi:hypothetical protein